MLDAPRFGKGWKKDNYDSCKPHGPTRALLGARRYALAPEAQLLEPLMQGVWNQQYTSSCVGHADAMAVFLRCAAMGAPIAKPSPTAIYDGALAVAREREGNPEEVLVDEGCQPSDAVEAMARFGIPNDSDWPPGGFDPARIVEESDELIAELEKAHKFLLTGWYNVDSEGSTRIDDIKQALSEKYPVVFGRVVTSAFENYMGGDPVTNDSSPAAGGHMMCIIGYRADGCFRVVNSWGSGWGDNGLYWCTPDFLLDESAHDFSAISVSALQVHR
jgi:hypothetical protein